MSLVVLGGLAHFSSEDHHGDNAGGENEESGHCQLRLLPDEENNEGDDSDRFLDDGAERGADGVLNDDNIVETGQQFAGAGLVKKAQRKIQQMPEKFGPQVADGAD